MLCFVIDNWLRIEGVYERSALRRMHAVILFLQFTIGILHGKRTSDELMNESPIYFERVKTHDAKYFPMFNDFFNLELRL